jgi:epidermal growth factor receptor substrate 15
MASPASKPIAESLSPFEDPTHQPLHLQLPLPQRLTPPGRSPSPSPRLPDTPNNDALEEFKKETARLSAQVESLLRQLTAQNRLRDSNENLRNENDSLKSQLRDMERTVSEVLSANDLNGSQEQLTQEITRLNAELVNKESQTEHAERMLSVLKQEEQELRASLREAQAATTKAKTEADELRQKVTGQEEEIEDLSGRLADMSNAMAEPNSATNNRQLRLVFKDVTKENEKLKGEVRDMQKSMEQFLLSTKFHAQYDELDRENRRLKQHIQELEFIATTSQTSENANGRLSKSNSDPRGVESLTRENELLRSQLKDGQRAFADLRSRSETNSVELQQQIDRLMHENNRLKIDAESPTRTRPQEDNVPPPSYDDSFVVPP